MLARKGARAGLAERSRAEGGIRTLESLARPTVFETVRDRQPVSAATATMPHDACFDGGDPPPSRMVLFHRLFHGEDNERHKNPHDTRDLIALGQAPNLRPPGPRAGRLTVPAQDTLTTKAPMNTGLSANR